MPTLVPLPALAPSRSDRRAVAIPVVNGHHGRLLWPAHLPPGTHDVTVRYLDARDYSAPHTLIGKQRDGNFREHVVAILYRGQRVSSHARLHGQGRQSSTQAEHMPTGHREMAEWTPPRIVNGAASVGLHTRKLMEALIKRKQHPPQAFRAAGGSIRLGTHYGNARVEAACRRAFRTNAISYSSVDSILKHRLDELPLPQDARQSSLPIVHDNVRGPDYVH